MDLTRPVTYRGLLLTGAAGGPGGANPIEGIRLTRARYTDVTVHGYTEKKSLEDGMDSSDVFIGMRRVSLQGEVFATSKARLFEFLDVLRLKFTPTDAYNEAPYKRGYLPLLFSQPTIQTVFWPTGFVDRVINCRPAGQPEYDIDLSSIGGDPAGGYVVPFATQLEAIDPRFYAPAQVEVNMGGFGMTYTLTNRGNYYAPLNLVLVMPASESGEYLFTWSGLGSNFTIKVPTGATERIIRMDGQNKVVTMDVNSVEMLRMDLITFTGNTTFPKVPPTPEGESPATYSWTCTGNLDAAQSRLWFNEAWI